MVTAVITIRVGTGLFSEGLRKSSLCKKMSGRARPWSNIEESVCAKPWGGL
jgi:hypothetical protein